MRWAKSAWLSFSIWNVNETWTWTSSCVSSSSYPDLYPYQAHARNSRRWSGEKAVHPRSSSVCFPGSRTPVRGTSGERLWEEQTPVAVDTQQRERGLDTWDMNTSLKWDNTWKRTSVLMSRIQSGSLAWPKLRHRWDERPSQWLSKFAHLPRSMGTRLARSGLGDRVQFREVSPSRARARKRRASYACMRARRKSRKLCPDFFLWVLIGSPHFSPLKQC